MFKSRSKPAAPQRRAASTSVPAHTQAAPPATQQSGGGMLSGIGSTIAQGMAFGTGSAIAHRAVGAAANAMTGGSAAEEVPREELMATEVPQQQQAQLSGPCASDKEMFFDCLKVNQGDQQACSFLYDALKTCQVNSTSGTQMSFQ